VQELLKQRAAELGRGADIEGFVRGIVWRFRSA
jgi:hypothetical protein